MTAAQLLRQQIDLANTAHQREVADLQAAGLNPVLSANTSGAAVPNLSSFITSSGGSSAGGSGGSSARTQLQLTKAYAKANPVNKVMETADHAIDAVTKLAEKQNSAKVIMQMHPERQAAADAGLNELVQNIANYNNNNSESGSSASSARAWYQTPLGSMLGGPVASIANIIHGFRSGAVTPRSALQVISSFVGGREGSILRSVSQQLK